MEETTGGTDRSAPEAARHLLDRLMQVPATRRQVFLGSFVGAATLAVVGCTPPGGGGEDGVTYAAGSAISNDNRMALRALWDAIIPGTWKSVSEDGGAPGADQAHVQAWLEQVVVDNPDAISWLTASFFDLWGADLNAWSRLNTLFTQNYDQLALGKTVILPATRQGKVILMMNLLVPGIESIFDLEYLAAIMLAKLAFYGDFWFEANRPDTMVGRAYCGAHLPPGTTPYANFSFGSAIGISDPRLGTANGLVAIP